MNMDINSFGLGHPLPVTPGPRKPRLALMGEFSAGKSTLANLLVGASHLPVQVTATQLPPVWLSQGTSPPFRVDLQGKSIPVSLARLEDVPIAETACIRIFGTSATLAQCDIIDMPGISDPNMPAAIWQRILPLADGVIWCTHATQAWRQSESAIWATMTPELQQRSLLLLTRIDKILSDRDRLRVIKRVSKETDGLFAGPCLPVSLTQAVAATPDSPAFASAGAAEVMARLADLIDLIRGDLGHPVVAPAAASPAPAPAFAVLPRRIRPEAALSAPTARPRLVPADPQIIAFRTAWRPDPQ